MVCLIMESGGIGDKPFTVRFYQLSLILIFSVSQIPLVTSHSLSDSTNWVSFLFCQFHRFHWWQAIHCQILPIESRFYFVSFTDSIGDKPFTVRFYQLSLIFILSISQIPLVTNHSLSDSTNWVSFLFCQFHRFHWWQAIHCQILPIESHFYFVSFTDSIGDKPFTVRFYQLSLIFILSVSQIPLVTNHSLSDSTNWVSFLFCQFHRFHWWQAIHCQILPIESHFYFVSFTDSIGDKPFTVRFYQLSLIFILSVSQIPLVTNHSLSDSTNWVSFLFCQFHRFHWWQTIHCQILPIESHFYFDSFTDSIVDKPFTVRFYQLSLIFIFSVSQIPLVTSHSLSDSTNWAELVRESGTKS